MKFLEKIKKPYKILAPMVGNSELAWRTLARRYGTNICFTEMVNCQTFLKSKLNPSSNQWFTTNKSDRPLIIQICGNDVEKMLQVSTILQDYCDAIDINLGCPQEIAKRGYYGSFLQEDWSLIENIVSTLSKKLVVPVTCKIRIFDGITKSIKYAQMIEKAGAKMLTVHGRTREQRGINTGLPSLEHIKQIKAALKIPVISNGGVIYHKNIEEILNYTKCDGIMIGETHLYNPMIFSDSYKNSLEIYKEYLDIFEQDFSEFDVKHIKSHSFKMLQVFLNKFTQFREKLKCCKCFTDYIEFYKSMKKFVIDSNIDEKNLRFEPYLRK